MKSQQEDGGARAAEREENDRTAGIDAIVLETAAKNLRELGAPYTADEVRWVARNMAKRDAAQRAQLEQLAQEIEAQPDAEHEIVFVCVHTASGDNIAIGLDAGRKLLASLSEKET